jgi:DNA-binding MarR family transcriptional regulator
MGEIRDELVVRGRWGRIERERDELWLRWVGRFRFVTVELLAMRFGVSEQRAGVRVRRLEQAGMLQRSHGGVGRAAVVALTRAGARRVGLRDRRVVRSDAQRGHELAIARLVARTEARQLTAPLARLLTEREARDLRSGALRDLSIEVPGAPAGQRRRWPDLILERDEGRPVAIEVELTLKGATRLARIIAAYQRSDIYAEARYLVCDARVARAVSRLAAAPLPPTAGERLFGLKSTTRVTVAALPVELVAARD